MIQRNLDSAEMPQMVSVAHSLCGATLAIISPAVFSQIVRVQNKDGTKRIATTPTETLQRFLEKVSGH